MNKISLFDFIKLYLFGSKDKWDTLLDADKKKYYFMSLRTISIAYPVFASNLTVIKINPVYAMDYMHRFLLSKHRGSPPRWIFTKTDKANNTKIDKDHLNVYMKLNQLNDSDINFMIRFVPDILISDLKKIKKDLTKKDKHKKK